MTQNMTRDQNLISIRINSKLTLNDTKPTCKWHNSTIYDIILTIYDTKYDKGPKGKKGKKSWKVYFSKTTKNIPTHLIFSIFTDFFHSHLDTHRISPQFYRFFLPHLDTHIIFPSNINFSTAFLTPTFTRAPFQ